MEEVTDRFNLPPRRRRIVIAAVAVAIGLLPGVAAASHIFSDVPTGHTFHANISAIAGAGITVGCGNGAFCPDDPITRGQEAAFVARGLPRIAQSTAILATDSTPAAGYVVVAQVSITVPGVGGDQFVVVDGSVTAQSDTDGLECAQPACQVDVQLRDVGNAVSSNLGSYLFPSALRAGEVVGKRYVFPATSGNHTYQLWARLGSGDILFYSDPVITAMSVPFGATGGSTLGAP